MCVCVCVCVNAIRTILQFTLVTHGHLFRVRLGATKGTNIPIITHNILIILIFCCLSACLVRCTRARRVLGSALTGGDCYGRGGFGVIFIFVFNWRGRRWC